MWGYLMGKQKSREVVFGNTNIACYLANYQVKIALLRGARGRFYFL
jgi:hypothetical protein